MGMVRLRAAILGCGPRAIEHAQAYREVQRGQLWACCDVDTARLHAFAERFSVPERYTDLGEMLARVRPDLLHVVTAPPFRPGVLAVLLAARPRAVLVEKPLARRPEEARAWIEGCQSAGIALFVNHQLRYHRPFIHVRQLLASGTLGRLEFGRGSCRGNLLEQGTHLFDLLDFVLSGLPVEWIMAQAEGAAGYAAPHSAPDYCAGVVCYRGGLHVGFECGGPAGTWRQEAVYWFNKGLEFVGERGRAGASTNHGWWAQTEGEGLQGESVPYPAEDRRAQAELTDSVLASLGHDAPRLKPGA
jgi:predicted dehydrogenase